MQTITINDFFSTTTSECNFDERSVIGRLRGWEESGNMVFLMIITWCGILISATAILKSIAFFYRASRHTESKEKTLNLASNV